MGTYFNNQYFQAFHPNVYIFDLEYVGTSNLSTCYIWDIGVVHEMSGAAFSVAIDPDVRPLPKPFSDDFITLSEEVLKNKKAVKFQDAWNMLLKWIHGIQMQYRVPNGPLIFISHNSFKGDKIILETDTKRHNIIMPYNWYFFDSLIYFRKIIPKLPSYALSDIYMYMMGIKLQSAHEALPDAVSLTQIIRKVGFFQLSGIVYPSYSTSLQCIKWLGPSSEDKMFQNGVRSVEDLIVSIMKIYSNSCTSGNLPVLKVLVKEYLQMTHGIKAGNANSISGSIVHNWLPGI